MFVRVLTGEEYKQISPQWSKTLPGLFLCPNFGKRNERDMAMMLLHDLLSSKYPAKLGSSVKGSYEKDSLFLFSAYGPFVEIQNFSKNGRETMNECRMYIKCVTLEGCFMIGGVVRSWITRDWCMIEQNYAS